MNKKIKAKWLRALRSGEFKQARNTLCEKTDEGYGFCCLGVLAHIAFPEQWVRRDEGHTFKGNDGLTGQLSGNRMAQIGLVPSDSQTLVDMNDGGQSFKQIANWIEKHL